MKTKLYIAYGSNLNEGQMAFRCPTAKPIAKSCLNDYRLVFQGQLNSAHANVIPEKGYSVPVVVWEITEADEKALDRYEGVAGGYYTKEYINIEIEDEMKEALIYIMTPHGYGIPRDFYLNIIAEGYKEFELPIEVLNTAVTHAYENTEKIRNTYVGSPVGGLGSAI